MTPLDYIFAVQGILLIGNGGVNLLFPRKAAAPSSPMAGTPVPVMQAMGLMSFTIGIFYLHAASQGNRTIMAMTLPGRFVAAVVFASHGGKWRQVAMYESFWEVFTIVGLLL